MCGKSRPGFGLLELLVAMALLGVVAAIVVPNIRKTSPKEQREQFIEKLNLLTKFAWQNGVSSGKIQKIEFDFEIKKITLHQDTGAKDKDGKPVTQPAKRAYGNTTVEIPDSLQFRNFFVEGFDEMTRFAGKTTEAVWFYIIPEGLAQSVIINFVDTKDRVAGSPRTVGLVLNPFSAQFQVYSAFQKPHK